MKVSMIFIFVMVFSMSCKSPSEKLLGEMEATLLNIADTKVKQVNSAYSEIYEAYLTSRRGPRQNNVALVSRLLHDWTIGFSLKADSIAKMDVLSSSGFDDMVRIYHITVDSIEGRSWSTPVFRSDFGGRGLRYSPRVLAALMKTDIAEMVTKILDEMVVTTGPGTRILDDFSSPYLRQLSSEPGEVVLSLHYEGLQQLRGDDIAVSLDSLFLEGKLIVQPPEISATDIFSVLHYDNLQPGEYKVTGSVVAPALTGLVTKQFTHEFEIK